MAKIIDGKIVFTDDDFGGVTLFGIDLKAPYQSMFKWAYRKHDLQYQLYKVSQYKSRLSIDREFLSDILCIVKRKKKYYLIPLCYVMYSAVRIGGQAFWNDKTNALNPNEVIH